MVGTEDTGKTPKGAGNSYPPAYGHRATSRLY